MMVLLGVLISACFMSPNPHNIHTSYGIIMHFLQMSTIILPLVYRAWSIIPLLRLLQDSWLLVDTPYVL